MCVCVCVCVCVCMRVCVSAIGMSVYAHKKTIHAYVYTSVRTGTHLHTYYMYYDHMTEKTFK